jgi:presqualene diphosphate synthase
MTPVAASEGPSPSAARRAAGSSFYAAMRILPRQRRNAIFEIYGFCRAVDDVADSDAPRDVRLKQLAQWRADIDALFAGAPPPRLAGLAAAVHTFRLSGPDFAAIVDGMEMDVVSDIRAPDFDTLDLYCDRVASAVGRLCVRVFGLETADGIALAHHLGRALQLTNILRDLDEDAAVGRLYLPREALAAGGIVDTDPAGVLASPTLGRACAVVVERARRHFDMADAVMRRSPRRSVRAPRIMAQAYKYMLARLIARGWSAPRQRVRLGRAYLIWVLLRHAVL